MPRCLASHSSRSSRDQVCCGAAAGIRLVVGQQLGSGGSLCNCKAPLGGSWCNIRTLVGCGVTAGPCRSAVVFIWVGVVGQGSSNRSGDYYFRPALNCRSFNIYIFKRSVFLVPSDQPSVWPTVRPSVWPIVLPSVWPTVRPSVLPSVWPIVLPSVLPTVRPFGRVSQPFSNYIKKNPSKNVNKTD